MKVISSTILDLGKIVLKCNVFMENSKYKSGGFVPTSPIQIKDNGMNINIRGSFTIFKSTDKVWSRDDMFVIDRYNIGRVKSTFNILYNNIISTRIFIDRIDEIKIDLKQLELNTFVIVAKEKSALKIHPSVIVDDLGVNYEAIRIIFNRDANFVDIPIDDFHTLYHTIKDLNLYTYFNIAYLIYLQSSSTDTVKDSVEDDDINDRKERLTW